jgi:hypothetical protein
MFNLIAVIFSIVLVIALGVAAFYYGGEAYSTKTQETDYAEIVNGASQIKAAMEMYRVRNGEYPGGIEDAVLGVSATEELLSRLVAEDYLSGVPRPAVSERQPDRGPEHGSRAERLPPLYGPGVLQLARL